MAKGAMTKSPKTGGKVYAGGSPNFDERTGRRTGLPVGSQRLSPGVYRAPSGDLVTGSGRVMPRPQQQNVLAGALQGATPMPNKGPAFAPEQYPLSQGMMAPQQQALSIFDVMKMNPQQQQQAFAQRPPAPVAGQMPLQQMPPQQMLQPSANMGGQYRLSPGVYGTREQAMQQMYQRVPGLQNGLGQQGNVPPIDWSQAVFYGQRKGY